MKSLYTELQWLPAVPADFAARIKAAGASEQPLGRELQALANHALDLDQSIRLAKAIQKARTAGHPLDGLTPFRLAVLSNATIDFIVPALVAAAARHGIALEVIQPSYDQVAQEAFTPDSKVNSAKPDAVLFAIDYRAVPLKPVFGDAEAAAQNVQGVIAYLKSLQAAIKANSGATCIFQTFAPPAESIFGSLDRALPGSIKNQLNAINAQIGEFCLETGDVLFDVDGLAQTVGIADWHDVRMWNMGKFAFSPDLIPLYADHVARLVAALRGKSRRCLILDLDNTVWGGIIGDDGLEGIKIAQGDAVGEAHLAVQKLALDLRARGIVLAVCSKNEDEIARTPFQSHPEMLLRLNHIAVFHANWNDKATNIKAIAEELSLGIDAMVFLDDNPVERGLVRKLLPSVAVPELPEDAALYARTLTAAGYFEAVAFASEDLKRAGYYQDNARRVQLQKQVEGVDAYLASLDMTITFQPFNAPGRARIAQLINKSNQFNLTTRRYTETDVQSFEDDPSTFTLQVRLADTFGDNGMISVIICKPGSDATWEIDTWLMSCRVLGRKVENMVLAEILEHARRAGITRLTGTFLPTERNKLVIQHYAKLGFAQVSEDASGRTEWALDVAGAQPDTAPMRVISQGFTPLKENTVV
ncbi:HAD-IIIC family phosphatase [Silvibacterium dinghuense]|uniref:HAD-IIIC family phosphatase n=1 Tax=Silvibacterium dinghuense TaxID=1560006 RepID=A0A4Q1SGW6_9BACT|nr:HAD-IIIC family phosphatase [Silvibacterium dinghuense]RXS96791.1 HAD-IIIC family phosphatase [Silvibacterium dinghuense]GGG93671.1 methoxymalonyl-ACP biosynthesis protein FkbH [Silvibacterium dinghuense]